MVVADDGTVSVLTHYRRGLLGWRGPAVARRLLIERFGSVSGVKQASAQDGHDFYAISAVTNQNVRELVNAVAAKLEALKRAAQENSVVELALSQ